MQQAGYPVHFVTVARWRAQNWNPRSSDHSLKVARGQLEAVAPLVSGDPETTLEDLIEAHKQDLDELTDAEVLRKAARELAIATTLVAKEIQNRVTASEFDLLGLTPAALAMACCVRALPVAFEQVVSLQNSDQRGNKG
jgi:hypothetical protein